jgi:hypothetical protein
MTRRELLMHAELLNAGEGHALRLGDVRMVVKEDGSHTRQTLGLAEFEVPPRGEDRLLTLDSNAFRLVMPEHFPRARQSPQTRR